MLPNSIGLPEFEILNVEEDSDGRCLIYEVRKVHPPHVCIKCGCITAFYKHGSEERLVWDTPISGKLTCLKIKSSRYKCRECGSTFFEEYDCINNKDRITERFRKHIQERCLKDTFTRIAQDYSLTATTVRRIFAEFVEANKEHLQYIAPRVMGIDEAHLNKIMRCVITDTEHNLLLDILEDRESKTIADFIHTMQHPENIKVVTMDMYLPYRSVIQRSLPAAKIVVDKFHVVQLINRKMDEVRKSVRQNLTPKEHRAMIYIAKLMKANKEAISPKSKALLDDIFKVYPILGTAYWLKERIRYMYQYKNRIDAGYVFKDFLEAVPPNCAPLMTAKTTFQTWSREIMNYFDNRYTNAYTESANNLIKKINKEGRSLSFEQMRYKALFSTKATRPPKFVLKKATLAKSQMFTYFSTTASTEPKKELIEGFGVDIDQLIKEI
ncbi:MAG: ISL3 family transposase [Desulfitobacterium hafniense]|nr:ISL3 family transposase [Desulfitobacterium hafniense]